MFHGYPVRPALTAAALLALAGCPGAPAPPARSTAAPAAAESTRPAASPAAPPTATPTAAPTTAPADPTAIARIGNTTITRGELDEALYKSYGIKLLADLAILDLAKQALAQHGQALTEADVTAERDRWFKTSFAKVDPEDYPRYYQQLKAQQHLSDVEFDLGFRTSAALRKLVRPGLLGRLKEETLRRAFELMYGGQRQVADCLVKNQAEAAEAHHRLATGERFADVVREMSLDDKSRRLPGDEAGELRPFTATTTAVSQPIVEAAFGLKQVGDVSDGILNDANGYHVIRLVAILPPKVVKYDDVKDAVREQVEGELEQQAIKEARRQLDQVAAAGLQITDPTLRDAWDAMIAAQQAHPPGQTLSPGQVDRKLAHPTTAPMMTAPVGPVGPPVPPAVGPATAPAPAGG